MPNLYPQNTANSSAFCNAQEAKLFDNTHIWHPYSALPSAHTPFLVYKADGVYLYTDHGKLIDGMSSWWAASFGYNHPKLNHAIKQQLDDMAHVMFGGLTHMPAINLAKKLLNIAPKGMHGVFFADSGSVAVEVALKMALQYHMQNNRTQDLSTAKRHFASTRSGYHGDTWHAMSVCDPNNSMHQLYGAQLPVQYFLDAPPAGFDAPLDEDTKNIATHFFAEHADRLAGFIIEPITQGAGGMRFYSPQYLRFIYTLCKRHNVLFIADEIATGFGRTGRLFACEYADICPDIMTLGKALTGGYMSFAAVLCHKDVQQTIHQGSQPMLMHGPTFMANALAACTASCAIDLALQYNTPKRALQMQQILQKHLNNIAHHTKIKQVRSLGAIGVIELFDVVNMAKFNALLPKYKIWVRPFGRLVYIMPPYIIDDDLLIILCNNLVELLLDYFKTR